MCVHRSYSSTTGCCAGPDLTNDVYVAAVLDTLDPLFSAYGWSYEYSWTNLTSIAGGSVHGLYSNKMAQITSDCGTVRSLVIKWP